ncbi:hypothetical protein BJF79_37060 [Actinomadura sp. CNU-125]|uniref:hypothetical protein n=1 Tax=Actinomadura sp. CNU-125 TaxID=1904961 RepID=UPI00095C16AA|nr:hypothetical protein [Actinomadura sp. CNU-125]OLT31471.1 hypothetical protein BJF79_37060 [Actinomadura sp. CNU-125]
MEFVALAAWVLAALAGGYLLITWIVHGGLATKVTRFPKLVVVGHPLAAVGGLALWIGHLVTADPAYAWWAFAALIVVVLQGFLLFTRWLVGRGGRHARGAEQAFPAAAVAVHGVVAAATVVLVFLTAMEVSPI